MLRGALNARGQETTWGTERPACTVNALKGKVSLVHGPDSEITTAVAEIEPAI